MCEATVYFEDDEGLKLYFDNVDKILPGEDQLILEDIFGQKKIIKAPKRAPFGGS